MHLLIGYLKKKSSIELIGVIALCVLVWFIGPKIVFGKRAPLEPELVRIGVILFVVLCWLAYAMFKKIRSNKKDQQLINDLASPQANSDQAVIEEAQKEEAVIIQQKFEEALKQVKKNRSKNRLGQNYLYELPLYIIIGAPGCGKTTLLLNSGLYFPLSEHLGENDIPGVGGTRNCDWLFSENTIFLDTAGRWTTQDSHQPVDAAAWKNFLNLLKKNRPRRPINGVLVTMSMRDLLQQTEETRWQHAKTVRQRIIELYEELGTKFPIYMLFTKCDLIAGFTEFFGNLSQEERSQVWGETFQNVDLKKTDENIIQFESNFDKLLERLNQRSLRRIHNEWDIQRRSLILDFPQQMSLLKTAMKAFLRDTFGTSRYEEFAPLLRGVYFTSATQEGTPIDRVMGLLANTFGLDRQKMTDLAGQGKSYFITRLIKEVIINESELAGTDPRLERIRWWLHSAAYVVLLLFSSVIILSWWVSYNNNKKVIISLEKQIKTYENLPSETTSWEGKVKLLLDRLELMHEPDYDRFRLMGIGLYRGHKVRAGFSRVYQELLKKNLLPIVNARLEQRIVDHLYGFKESDTDKLYSLLKTYLMLGEPKRMQAKQAELHINSDWKQCFPNEPRVQARLITHTNEMLKLTLDPLQLDDSLISNARQVLNAQPLYAQIYAHLQAEATSYLGPSYDYELKEHLPQNSDQVFTNIHDQSVPGLYTYEGYHEFFKKHGPEAVEKALEENWVLNTYFTDEKRDLKRLWGDMQRLYFHHYEKQWRDLLDKLSIKKVYGYDDVINILDIMAYEDNTPLRPLLELVEKNTTLVKKQEAGVGDGEDKESPKKSKLFSDPTMRHAYASGYVIELERKFKDLNSLVRSIGKSTPPLDNILKSLNNVRDVLIQMKSDGESYESIRQGARAPIRAAQIDIERQPEPFRSWFSFLTASTVEIAIANAKSELNAKWRTEVLAPYKASLQGRYPIFKNSRYDATLTDFSKLFKPNGILDQFFITHIKPYVNTDMPNWQPINKKKQTLRYSGNVLKQFQYAASIRKTFFTTGGSIPHIEFELTPVYLDPEIEIFQINIEGQTAKYQHGPPILSKAQFQWPGPQPQIGVRITCQTTDGRTITQTEEGTWAWFKILDSADVKSKNLRDQFTMAFNVDGHRIIYELRASSVYNPFRLKEFQIFRCPESL